MGAASALGARITAAFCFESDASGRVLVESRVCGSSSPVAPVIVAAATAAQPRVVTVALCFHRDRSALLACEFAWKQGRDTGRDRRARRLCIRPVAVVSAAASGRLLRRPMRSPPLRRPDGCIWCKAEPRLPDDERDRVGGCDRDASANTGRSGKPRSCRRWSEQTRLAPDDAARMAGTRVSGACGTTQRTGRVSGNR
jgi:hypothetical protein